MAGLTFSSIGVKRPIEVAALAVDVDIEIVEGCAPLRERLVHHVANMPK
jgi:hypothetical protein